MEREEILQAIKDLLLTKQPEKPKEEEPKVTKAEDAEEAKVEDSVNVKDSLEMQVGEEANSDLFPFEKVKESCKEGLKFRAYIADNLVNSRGMIWHLDSLKSMVNQINERINYLPFLVDHNDWEINSMSGCVTRASYHEIKVEDIWDSPELDIVTMGVSRKHKRFNQRAIEYAGGIYAWVECEGYINPKHAEDAVLMAASSGVSVGAELDNYDYEPLTIGDPEDYLISGFIPLDMSAEYPIVVRPRSVTLFELSHVVNPACYAARIVIQ